MRALAAATLLISVLGGVACKSPAQSRCERICTREDECATELNREAYDVGECVDECARLERDPQLVSGVDRHVECVDSARNCTVLMSCP